MAKFKFASTKTSSLSQVARSFINFIYPPFCLHCQDSLTDSSKALCDLCAEQLTLLSLQESLDPRSKPPTAAALLLYGPITSLLHALQEGARPSLADSLAGFLVAQLIRLDWPTPDIIVPVPPQRSWFNKSHTHQLLAQAMAKLLSCKVEKLVTTRGPKRGKCALMTNQTILVVGELLENDGHLQKCLSALTPLFPDSLYGLALCKKGEP